MEKLCKNLTAERMEGNSTNLQHSFPLLPSDDEGDEHLSHASASHIITPMIIATPGIKKVKVSIHK